MKTKHCVSSVHVTTLANSKNFLKLGIKFSHAGVTSPIPEPKLRIGHVADTFSGPYPLLSMERPVYTLK